MKLFSVRTEQQTEKYKACNKKNCREYGIRQNIEWIGISLNDGAECLQDWKKGDQGGRF